VIIIDITTLIIVIGLVVAVVGGAVVVLVIRKGITSSDNAKMLHNNIEQNDVIQGNTLCLACNKENPTGSSFCEYCSAKLND
jgi:hypothetical protein